MLDFTFGDLFCGAGGTSRGATRAGGRSPIK
jgi:site-specific DNA-cytosine methylase